MRIQLSSSHVIKPYIPLHRFFISIRRHAIGIRLSDFRADIGNQAVAYFMLAQFYDIELFLNFSKGFTFTYDSPWFKIIFFLSHFQ